LQQRLWLPGLLPWELAGLHFDLEKGPYQAVERAQHGGRNSAQGLPHLDLEPPAAPLFRAPLAVRLRLGPQAVHTVDRWSV
jgi:hypothetical protein